MHPDIQEKIHQEILTVVTKNDANISYADLGKLTFMEMCLKETMRLFPVLPFIARHSSEEVQLEDNIIPKGVTVVMPIFNIQRDKKSWGEDAGEFNPDRFLPENISKVHTHSYIPFGGGPRICIGMKYAMMNMKTVLAHFHLKYRVSTSIKYESLTYKLAISLKICQKYLMKIEKRNYQ